MGARGASSALAQPITTLDTLYKRTNPNRNPANSTDRRTERAARHHYFTNSVLLHENATVYNTCEPGAIPSKEVPQTRILGAGALNELPDTITGELTSFLLLLYYSPTWT